MWRQQFVSTWEQVGQFVVVQRKRRESDPGETQKQGGNVVSYFCTPQQEVLHFVVGPQSAAALLKEANWVLDVWRRMHSGDKHGVREPLAVLRRAHLERASSAETHELRKKLETWKERDIFVSQEEVTAEAVKFARHDGGGASLVLTELPLAPLAYLQKPVFEHLANEYFTPRRGRSDELLRVAQECRQQQRALLLLVVDKQPSDLERPEAPPSELRELSLAESGLVPKLTVLYRAVEMSLPELVRLCDDLGQEPPSASDTGRSAVRLVVMDRHGDRVAAFPPPCNGKTSDWKYARALEAALLKGLTRQKVIQEK